MNRKLMKTMAIFVVLMVIQVFPAHAANQKKVELGAVMLGVGTAMFVHGANNAICFGYCETSGAEVEAVAGLGMIGVGTFFLIKGLTEKNKTKLSETKHETPRTCISVDAGPVRRGWGGGVRVRW